MGIFASSTLEASPHENKFSRNFWNPIYHGKRLNYCSLDGKECGLVIASAYCQLMGYRYANQQIIDYNVGLTNYIIKPPMRLQARCRGWQCNGFKLIRCVDNFSHSLTSSHYYRLRHFAYPRFNHYRVDWCYDGKSGCGYKTAHSFCRRMGYKKSSRYQIDNHINATQAIGNQKLCFGRKCRGFSVIDCFR